MSIDEGPDGVTSLVRWMSTTSGRSFRLLRGFVVVLVFVKESMDRSSSLSGLTLGNESASSMDTSESESLCDAPLDFLRFFRA